MVSENLKNLILRVNDKLLEEEITEESNLVEDLGFDSLLIVQLIVEIESYFNIEMDDDMLEIDVITVFSRLRDRIYMRLSS